MKKRSSRREAPVRKAKENQTRRLRSRPGGEGSNGNGSEQAIAVVGIGASAGGFEAVSELLKHFRGKTGMAYVFIQHLDPSRKSQLAELLSRVTEMPVSEIK